MELKTKLSIIVFVIKIILLKIDAQALEVKNESNCNVMTENDYFPRLNISLKFPSTTAKKEGLYVFYNSSTILIESLPRSVDFYCVSEFPVDWSFQQSLSVKWDHWEIEYGRIYFNETHNYFFASLNLLKINPSTLPTLGKEGPFCTNINNSCFQATVNGEYFGLESDTLIYFKNTSNIQSRKLFRELMEDVNCTIKMGFNEETQEFFCETLDLETRPLIYVKSCPNPTRCESERYHRNCPNEPPNYETCKPPFCEKIKLNIDYLPAVAYCRLKSRNAAFTIQYFYSINHNSKVKRYFDWNETDGSDMIVISKQDEIPIFPLQPLTFTCNASYYYFASGLRFKIFDSQNDITHYVNKAFMEEIEFQKTASSFYKLNRTLEINITLEDPGTYRINCYAPVWNSSQWISTSTTFNVNESFIPIILNQHGNTEELIHIELSDLNETKCIANGLPIPRIEWKDEFGYDLPKYFTITVENNTENSSSTISFPSISNQMKGLMGTTIYCVAINSAGSTNISYFIEIPKESHLGLIVSMSAGGLLLITIGIIAALSWKVKKQKEKLKLLSNEEIEEFFNGHSSYVSIDGESCNYVQAQFLPYNQEYEMDMEHFKIGEFMDSGTDKIVHFGTVIIEGIVQKVAISQPKRDLKPVLYELKILASIGTHENIVNLVRACTKNLRKGEVLVATELCENGSLLKYLKNNKELFEQILLGSLPPLSTDGVQLHAYVTMTMLPVHNPAFIGDYEMPDVVRHNNNDLINWSIQIARGMDFLIKKFIIHGDLAARNVLLTGNRIAKICDFGLSKKIDYVNTCQSLEKSENENQKVPWRSAAPEVLRSNKLSPKSDVWSYGVTIWEIFSLGATPYNESYRAFSSDFIESLEIGRIQLHQPYLASKEMFMIMQECWELNTLKRPTFEEILIKISNLL